MHNRLIYGPTKLFATSVLQKLPYTDDLQNEYGHGALRHWNAQTWQSILDMGVTCIQQLSGKTKKANGRPKLFIRFLPLTSKTYI